MVTGVPLSYALFIIDATSASVEGKMNFSAAPSKE
jgi:hypothetical protein